MPNPYRVFKDDNYAYFVTCTIVDWLPVFTAEPYCQIILDSLAFIREHKATQLNAYVLMPTHLHAILWPAKGVFLSDILRDFKRFTSRKISGKAQENGDESFLVAFSRARHGGRLSGESNYQVWQEGSHPEAIYSEEFAHQKMDYMHQNPIRAGLVRTILDWQYSSAPAYYSGIQTYPPIDLIDL